MAENNNILLSEKLDGLVAPLLEEVSTPQTLMS